MAATTHSHARPVDAPAATAVSARVRLRLVTGAAEPVRPATHWKRKPHRAPIVVCTLLAHVALVVALWYAKPWAPGPQPPPRLEVALIAPPEPEKPKPPPPRVPNRPPPRPQPLAIVAPVPMPPVPMPTMIPTPLVSMPVVSPITVVEAAVVTAPPAPPAKPIEPPPVDVVQPRFDAAYLDNPAPIYPAAAKRTGEEGRVLLRVLVSSDGLAQTVDVAKSSGFERLDAAALEAVRRWRFVPARRGDANVAAYVNVPVAFAIRR